MRKPLSRLLLSTVIACGAAANAQPVDPTLYSSLHWRLLGPFRAGWAVAAAPDRSSVERNSRSGSLRMLDTRHLADDGAETTVSRAAAACNRAARAAVLT